MNRNEKLKRKYAYIHNAFGDSKTSNKAKHWGWKTIERELGLKQLSNEELKNVELKQYKDRTLTQKKMELSKTQKLRAMGFTPSQIRRYKRKSYKDINSQTTNIIIGNYEQKIYMPSTRKERYEVWKYWSGGHGKVRKNNRDKYMPELVKQSAYRINYEHNPIMDSTGQNRKNIHQQNKRFGFAVLYFKYVENISLKRALKIIEPDDNDIHEYIYTQKVW